MQHRLLALAVACSTVPARADVVGLVAVDSYLATSPSITTDDAADVAWSVHAQWREAEREPERSAVLDWVERESLIGGTPRRELHELSYQDRSLDHLAITVGRYRVPGGFWLIADGGELTAIWPEVEVSAYAGSRSFTNGRSETLLTTSPHLLPLAGAAVTTRGDLQATLSYTRTEDRIAIYRGLGMTTEMSEPEQFFDAEVLAPIGDHAYVTGGATIGSRYLVSYAAMPAQIADDPRVENVWFGSQALYALADWRTGEWRLDASVTALRTKLGQVTDSAALASITGSFVESALRATWHRDRMLRIDMRYRARVWADWRHAHRAQVAAQWRQRALVVDASVGFDVHENAGMVPGLVDRVSALYRASVGHKTAGSEVAVGIAAVSTIGDEIAAGPADDASDNRAPYTLEARSYGFVTAFATRGAWFGGIDTEFDVHGGGIRALVQLGCSR